MGLETAIILSSVVKAGGKGLEGYTEGNFARAEGSRAVARGRFTKGIAEINAKLADRAAERALESGEFDAELIDRRASQIVGEQRAAAAAGGVSVDSSTIAALNAEARILAARDMMQAKTNAIREAYGFKTQAAAIRRGGEIEAIFGQRARRTGKRKQAQTLLSGFLQAGRELGGGLQGFAASSSGADTSASSPPGFSQSYGATDVASFPGVA